MEGAATAVALAIALRSAAAYPSDVDELQDEVVAVDAMSDKFLEDDV